MSDGRLVFETEIDSKGFRNDLSKLSAQTNTNLKDIGNGFQKTGAKLTNFLTKPALGAAVALGGMTIGKGLSRLGNIDNAKAKLEGLGHSAKEVDKIMDSALESVRGTAYGLDAAATTAASAVAAGIKPGKELTRYLKLVGDAASIAGISMDEMGSIFNRVAANGKMTTQELYMLQDRGIPMTSLLAKSMHKSMAEVKEDLSAGKIGVEEFTAAIEEGMGGAALTMGTKTLSAAMDNLWAAVARVGANFISAGGSGNGVFDQLRGIVVDLTNKLGTVEEKAKVWGDTFGKAFNKVIDIARSAPTGVLAGMLGGAVAIGPILKMIGAVLKATSALRAFQAASTGTSLAMGVLTGKISAGSVVLGKFGNLVSSAASGTANLAKAVGSNLAGAYGTLTNKLATLNPKLQTTTSLYGKGSSSLYGSNSGLKAAASGLASYTRALAANSVAHLKATASAIADTVANSGFGRAVSGIAKSVAGATATILRFAAAHAVALGAAGLLIGGMVALGVYMHKTGTSSEEMAEKITDFSNRAAQAITTFAENLPSMIDAFLESFTANIGNFESMVETLIPAITNSLVSIIQAITDNLPTLIESIANIIGMALPVIVAAGVKLLMGLADSVQQVIGPLVAAIPPLITALANAIVVLAPAILQAGITLLMALVDALPQIITALASALPNMISQIAQMIITLVPVILDAAVTLFMALVEAIPQIVTALVGAFPQILEAIRAGFEQVRAAVSEKMNAVKDNVKEKIKSIISQFSFAGLVAKVKGVWNNVKSAITSPIDSAKEKVSQVLKKIKSLFPMSVGKVFSSLKLPRITVSGGKAPFGIAGKGSLPKFSVHWAKKGGIVDAATLIGAGEAGAEAILPLDRFWKKMDTLAMSIMSGMKYVGNRIEDISTDNRLTPHVHAARDSFVASQADRRSLNAMLGERTNESNGYFTVNVNGAEDPELWADRFVRKLKLDMRTT